MITVGASVRQMLEAVIIARLWLKMGSEEMQRSRTTNKSLLTL